jgi:hypothetical protein
MRVFRTRMRARTEGKKHYAPDHSGMRKSYAVTWQHGEGGTRSGRLELVPGALTFEGSDANSSTTETVDYGDLLDVRVGRSREDRISERQTLVLERRTGGPIRIASVVHPGIISELAEHLASKLGEERVMSRAVVVLPLREGVSEQAGQLLRGGPPFDPDAVGLERHHVFLTDREAVFVFEADSQDAAEKLIGDESFWSAASAWKELVAGPPRLAEDVYSWVRPHMQDDVSFAPTPGPGDSDGGDIY